MLSPYLSRFTDLPHLGDRESFLGQGIFNRDDEVIKCSSISNGTCSTGTIDMEDGKSHLRR